MAMRGIRGATTVTIDEPGQILRATQELIGVDCGLKPRTEG